MSKSSLFLAAAFAAATCCSAQAATYPNQESGVFTVPSFTFHTGETLENFNLGYTVLGNRAGEPVLILHGTNGGSAAMLADGFAGELFGPGQPLDADKYFIIIPDAIGTGKSSKPSDGLKASFPHYNYADMVLGQYRLVTEGFGVKHLRLIVGNSMGGMQTWLWTGTYPDFMDAAMPLASLPQPMSGRNWMTRRMIIDLITGDPEYQDGNYTTQPKMAAIANTFYNLATNGGTLHLYKLGPDGKSADAYVDKQLAAPFKKDANDTLYQWASSKDYDPTAGISKIGAQVVAINSADDERNPQIFGALEKAAAQNKNISFYIIPESAETVGHGTTMQAKYWKQELVKLLERAPHRKIEE
ncbi:MAG: alpha/beta fold hydrolase [Candidatus Anaerobiospirillum merdipullorum]|uniref:Alpha/beta fold hydrolase n=1 Tax=Candidatus Anaerobiospirillum merdipullorum TaxID=2838450 RepID=A0A9E2KM85_9GAMM|nr:alpha/beta fold hydrolase [Candidatus Anaerobiospirillum merdipullorum]